MGSVRLIAIAVSVAFGTLGSAHAEIIISEIMYDPQGTDRDDNATPAYNREWLEIFNTGTSSIDISG